jgi:outer membrane protein, heavy metal efflux system
MNQHIRLCAFILHFLILPGIATSQSADVPTAMTIRDAVDVAMRASYETSRQDALLDIAHAEREQAGLYMNPEAGFSIEQLRHQGASLSEWTLAVDYPFLSLLTRGKRIGAADFAVRAAAHRRTRSLEALAYNVRDRFTRLWQAREMRNSFREIETVLRSLDRTTTRRSGEGDISAYEEQRLRTELSRLRWRHTEASASVREAEAELALLMALPLDALEARRLMLPQVITGAPDLASLQATALERRADLQALRAEQEELRRRGEWIGTQWMDELRLGGGYKRQSDDFRGPVFTVSLPLAVFHRDQGSSRAVVADEARLIAQIRELEQRIALEIQGGVATIREIQEQAAELRFSDEAEAARFVTAATTAYREGEFSLVEFLDAIRAHIDNAELRSAVRASLLRAAFRLEYAAGGSIFTLQETN